MGPNDNLRHIDPDAEPRQCVGRSQRERRPLRAENEHALPLPAVATNSNGTIFGPDQIFTTIPHAPTAVTSAATFLSKNGATLNGIVNPGALATTYHFEYGTSLSYGTSTSTLSAGNGAGDVPVTSALAGLLEPNTTYHFRIVATNSRGSATSGDQIFTTSPLPRPLGSAERR